MRSHSNVVWTIMWMFSHGNWTPAKKVTDIVQLIPQQIKKQLISTVIILLIHCISPMRLLQSYLHQSVALSMAANPNGKHMKYNG